MSVRYPSHLYIRIDRDLRTALVREAGASGETVSALVRRRLGGTVARQAHDPAGNALPASCSHAGGGPR